MWGAIITLIVVVLIITVIAAALIMKVRNRAQQAEKRVENLGRQLSKAVAETSSWRQQTIAARAQYDALRGNYDGVCSVAQSSADQIAQLEQALEELRQHSSADTTLNERVEAATAHLAALQAETTNYEKMLEEAQNKCNALHARAQMLLAQQETARALAASSNEKGFVCVLRPCLDPSAARLAALCEEVIGLAAHPEITKALRGFVWSKLWLPVFQRMLKGAGVWDARNTIYLLRSRTDSRLCYVGQATCLRERWYQHARKLLGVDSCGNERLYGEGLAINDLEWCVVTEGLADSDLSATESYYIKWFGADSGGLNKKR